MKSETVSYPSTAKLYYSIGEVAELTQLQAYTLRAWEKEFPCLRPRRVRGKNRAYRQRDIGVILLIKRLLYEERYSTRGAQQKLRCEPELVRSAGQSVVFPTPSSAAREAVLAAGFPTSAQAGEPRESVPEPKSSAPADDLMRELRRDLEEILEMLS